MPKGKRPAKRGNYGLALKRITALRDAKIEMVASMSYDAIRASLRSAGPEDFDPTSDALHECKEILDEEQEAIAELNGLLAAMQHRWNDLTGTTEAALEETSEEVIDELRQCNAMMPLAKWLGRPELIEGGD